LPLNFKTLRLFRSKNIFSRLWNPLKNRFLSNTIVLAFSCIDFHCHWLWKWSIDSILSEIDKKWHITKLLNILIQSNLFKRSNFQVISNWSTSKTFPKSMTMEINARKSTGWIFSKYVFGRNRSYNQIWFLPMWHLPEKVHVSTQLKETFKNPW
jgi:hypothetical protein